MRKITVHKFLSFQSACWIGVAVLVVMLSLDRVFIGDVLIAPAIGVGFYHLLIRLPNNEVYIRLLKIIFYTSVIAVFISPIPVVYQAVTSDYHDVCVKAVQYKYDGDCIEWETREGADYFGTIVLVFIFMSLAWFRFKESQQELLRLEKHE